MKFLLETIRLGLTNLQLHLLRSVLTALGIILGVAAVIVMSSLGEDGQDFAGGVGGLLRSRQPKL